MSFVDSIINALFFMTVISPFLWILVGIVIGLLAGWVIWK